MSSVLRHWKSLIPRTCQVDCYVPGKVLPVHGPGWVIVSVICRYVIIRKLLDPVFNYRKSTHVLYEATLEDGTGQRCTTLCEAALPNMPLYFPSHVVYFVC
jgi:hypothetical protein